MEPIAESNGRRRVLLVEDEFLIAEWMSDSLSELGFAVSVAANAADALRQLAERQTDVLFTDINLRGEMDGINLARRARELMPHLPVVYASGRFASLEQGERVPGGLFVRKPYEPAVVGRLLADAIRSMIAVPA